MAQNKPKIIYWKAGMAVRGKQVYLDANFIVGLNKPGHIWHTTANGLLEMLVQRQLNLVLSSLALNEAVYQLMRLNEKEQVQAEVAEDASSQPKPDYSLAQWLDKSLFNLPNLRYFEPSDAVFHRRTLQAIQQFNLDPTDAFHYTAATHLNCPLVSNDAGFQKIPDSKLIIVTFF